MRLRWPEVEVERATWVLLAVAAVSVGWARYDAHRDDGPRATLVSTRSAAWRVLPELANTDSAGATIELHPASGDPVRLVPEGLRHLVMVGDAVLGPADPEAVEGVWDSLRMATTLRAVDEAADPGVGNTGRIVVELPQGGTRAVVLGFPSPDGAGLYGVVEGGAEGTEGLWVLERELGVLVEQAPQTWLARRAVVVEPADVLAVHEGDLHLSLGIDGLWRARVGQGAPAILDAMAVKTRLHRLVSARLDPLVDPRDDAGTPWIELEGIDGGEWSLRQHGPCPGRDDRVLVDRGPGVWGCLDAALAQPWPAPGRPGPDAGALLDPRLSPHDYGRVLRIEQHRPQARTLLRYGGGWRVEEDLGDRTTLFDVDEPEVYRWYQALFDAEVALEPEASWPQDEAGVVDLTVVTDTTATLRLRCTATEPARCRRDEGPVLRLRQALPPLAFSVETFSERRLVSVASEDVRAIEILPADAAAPVLRQSMHFDLGVWRLDAPSHPAGDAALDELALEGLLATIGALRAEAWVDGSPGAPQRWLRVETVPRRGEDPVIELRLHEGCVVEVTGHRPARVPEGACATLQRDLLVMQPLARALLDARSLELSRGGLTTRLQPRAQTWVTEDGAAAVEASAWLEARVEQEAIAVLQRPPPSPVAWTLRLLPTRGTAYAFEGGEGWLGLQGEGWFYALADASAPSPEPEVPDELPDELHDAPEPDDAPPSGLEP